MLQITQSAAHKREDEQIVILALDWRHLERRRKRHFASDASPVLQRFQFIQCPRPVGAEQTR